MAFAGLIPLGLGLTARLNDAVPAPLAVVHPAPAAPATVHPASVPVPSLATPTWNLITSRPPTNPSARSFSTMAYDPVLGGELVFGGTASGTPQKDTYTFINGVWTQITKNLTVSPEARSGASLVWDDFDQEMVLFGGQTAKGFAANTWIFNATGWWNVTSASTSFPSARGYSSAFYDPTIQKVVLFGGACKCGPKLAPWWTFNDTWEFQGGTWTNVSATINETMPPMEGGYAAWDPVDLEGILYGGTSSASGCVNYNRTWTWNGTGWTDANLYPNPGNYTQGGLAWDGIDGYMVMFGGSPTTGTCLSAPAVTWTFLSGVWTNYTSIVGTATPKGRCCNAMAYDPIMKAVVSFGGNSKGKTPVDNSETWTYPAAPIVASVVTPAVNVPVGINYPYALNMTGGLGPFDYNWSWGDATANDTTVSASHTYATVGSYSLNVKIQDAQDRFYNASTTINVVPDLTALAVAAPLVGERPLKVTFNASHAGGDGPWVQSWHFGDGATSGTVNTTHTYNVAGNFTSYYKVDDAAAEEVNITQLITVYGPLATTIAPLAPIGAAPFFVSFLGNASGGHGPYTYDWVWGDNTTDGSGAAPTHTFLSQGSFTVKETVTDSLGYTTSQQTLVSVFPALAFTVDASINQGLPPLGVTFSASGAGGVAPLTYSWDYGDGTPNDTGSSVVSHTFQGAGQYTVTLLVVDAVGDQFTNTTVILVTEPLTTGITTTATKGPAPLTVSFSASALGGIPASWGYLYNWDFGDGSTASNATSTSHTYTTLGNYSVTLTTRDNAAESATASVIVTTYLPLSVSVTANPSSVILGNSSTLTALAKAGLGIRTYAWVNLPTGCTSRNSSTLSCKATGTGVFVVGVAVSDTAGDVAAGNATLTVKNATPVCTTDCGGDGGTTTGNGTTTAGIPISYLALAAVIAVAAIAAAVVMLRRRGPPGPSDEGDEQPMEEMGEGGEAPAPAEGEYIYGMDSNPPPADEVSGADPTSTPEWTEYGSDSAPAPQTGDEDES